MKVNNPFAIHYMIFDENRFKAMVEEAVISAFSQLPQPVSSSNSETATEKTYIHSIKGLAEFLNCSVVTAQHLKDKGLIPYMQVGRKVMFDKELVLASMRSKQGLKGRK